MRLGILFWFYKDLPLCVNRARLLRKFNPTLPIFGLFGGDVGQGELYRRALSPWLDDFYAFPEERSASWKWLQGDQLITRWFTDRGSSLDWDTVFVAQWDLLLLAPLQTLCSRLEPGQLLLPGLRRIREIEDWWYWVKPGSAERRNYDRFMQGIEERHGVPRQPLCCNFIAAAFPRSFLARYSTIPEPDVGFLEYKIPVYGQVWGMEFCSDHPFEPVWYNEERNRSAVIRYFRTFYAEKRPIRTAAVALHAVSPWGRRAFHPYTRPFPVFGGRTS